MQRASTLLLAFVLLLAGGPAWAIELCLCGDAPKLHCCCCIQGEPDEAAISTAEVCETVVVAKASSPSTAPTAAEPQLAAAALVLPRLVLAPPLRVAVPSDTARAWRGSDPPYMSVRSLRI